VDDVTRLYFDALKNIDVVKGHAFNVGGGMSNRLSLVELFALLGEIIGRELEFDRATPRHSDQLVFVASREFGAPTLEAAF
jgi:CDP-paratose 2-epimerase